MATICRTHEYPLDEEYPDFDISYETPVAAVLTKELYKKYKSVQTPKGFTLDATVQLGVDNPKHLTGAVFGDEDSYSTFKDLFDPLILKVHNYLPDQKQQLDLDVTNLNEGSLDAKYISQISVRGCRNIKGFPLPPLITRKERRQLEKLIVESISSLPEEFRGKYYSFGNLKRDDMKELASSGIEHTRPTGLHTVTMGLNRDWPDARGVWLSSSKELTVWVNVKDHVRLSLFSSDTDVKRLMNKYKKAIEKFSESLTERCHEVMWTDHLGYINQDLADLGPAFRINMLVKIPFLMRDTDKLKGILKKMKLLGKHSYQSDILEIANLLGLGQTEMDIVKKVSCGVASLIKMEQALENGRSIEQDVADIEREAAGDAQDVGGEDKNKM